MKYVWVVMAAFFFGLGAGLLLCNSTISHLRRRLHALRLNGDQGKKTETMKKVVWICLGNGFAWIWCSYVLAYLGREQIAETLSSVAVKEIIGVVLAYAIKSVLENLSKNNHWPDKPDHLRQKGVKSAVSYLGCKEADGSHRKIIDLYNSHKPLARGYAVKYTDAWCSTFASAVAIAAGLTDIIPTECGCEKHIALFKKLGAWVENDAYVPKPGDYIFYDWQDGTNYATTDNTGAADHVGIVTEVNGSTITVIEGNMSDAVGYRHIAVNGRYIRGYGVPKYASKATGTDAGTTGGETGGTGNTGAGTCKAGDIVNFTGGKHYTNANAASGTACKPGKAKVTQVYQPGKAKHPYHLVAVSGGGSTVYGWVDAADIGGSATGGTRTHTVVRGDTLWALASTYLGSGSRYKEIMRLNGLTSEIIHVGQVLKMPAK